MQKILNKVTRRQEYREKQSSENSASLRTPVTAPTNLKKGDDIFPVIRRPIQGNTPAEISKSKQAPMKPSHIGDEIKEKLFKDKPKIEEKEQEDEESGGKRTLKLVKNRDNNGVLFDGDGRPFWQQRGKGLEGRDDIDAEDLTDDELPMNAEVLLDVHSGKIKLVDMPTQEITLDPFAPLEKLDARDEQFFIRNVLFSNTVRSMINLNDDATISERKKKTSSDEKKQITWMPQPKVLGTYSRQKPKKIKKQRWPASTE
uniref:Uncharacterized protein n=1 Tax=Steinernema glaseri TaxID=37863 RepID=A0A1I8APB7_9BILA